MKIKMKNKLLMLSALVKRKAVSARNTLVALATFTFSGLATASTTGTDFKTLFDWVNEALSGYLGMAIAIIATIIGLGNAALGGKMVVSLAGIGVAIIAALAPAIIDAIFNSAII